VALVRRPAEVLEQATPLWREGPPPATFTVIFVIFIRAVTLLWSPVIGRARMARGMESDQGGPALLSWSRSWGHILVRTSGVEGEAGRVEDRVAIGVVPPCAFDGEDHIIHRAPSRHSRPLPMDEHSRRAQTAWVRVYI
jgi:hypothetical protein